MKKANILRVLVLLLLSALFIPARPAQAVGVVTLSTNQGSIGQDITISGTGFDNPNEDRGINIIFGKANPGATMDYNAQVYQMVLTWPLDSSGGFSASFKVPANLNGGTVKEAVTNGVYYVYLTYYYPLLPQGPAVLYINTFTVANPELAITPTEGTVGSELKINGTGFGLNETITVKYDGQTQAFSGDSDTNSNGAFGDTLINIPPSPAGLHTITVSDQAPSATSEKQFRVLPSMSMSPASGAPGTSIDISGTGFGASKSVTIYFNDAQAAQASSDAQGNFSTSLVPSITAPGTYTVKADDGTNSKTASFSVTSVLLDINPASGEKGTTATINGTGFLPNHPITVTFNGANVATTPPQVTTNSNGAFPAQFKVPAIAPGDYQVTATDGTNAKSVTFKVVINTFSDASPQTTAAAPGHIGSQITLSGEGYTPGAALVITFDGAQLGQAAVGTDGKYAVAVEIPAAKAGNHVISVTDGTNTSQLPFFMESQAPNPPQPLQPAMDIKAKPETFFDWEDVTDESGVTYQLQIATDTNFTQSSIVLDKKDLTVSEYTVPTAERLLNVKQEAPYYWRLRALDGAGNASPWTGTGSFYVGSQFGVSQPVIYVLIGAGALIFALFTFWLGRKTAYY